MTSSRLISADSHVAISLDAIRERVPAALHEAFDDAIAEQARIDAELKRGKQLSLDDFDMEAMRDPGYRDPVARLAAMDRDGVDAEVLYSEVSAFRAFGLVQGDWRPISRAFTDLLSEFAAHDPNRLAVSYQVPIIDIPYAVSEVERLAGLGARSVHLPNFPSELGLPDYHEDALRPAVGRAAGDRHLDQPPPRQPQLAVGGLPPRPHTAGGDLHVAPRDGARRGRGVVDPHRHPRTVPRSADRVRRAEPLLDPRLPRQLDRKVAGPYDLPNLRLKPSEYFHRNMACTFMDDEVGLNMRHLVGIENILWSTDFPHPATTWPNSQEVVARQFADDPRRRARADLCGELGAHLPPLRRSTSPWHTLDGGRG